MQVNEIVVGVGSNLNPYENINNAKIEISRIATVAKESQFVNTRPVNYVEQPDFIYGAFIVQTYLDFTTFKTALKKIEAKLGRIKPENKISPRTIDLDIVIFNRKKVDKDVLQSEFVRNAVSELLPDFKIKI